MATHRILVVEDEAIIAREIRHTLEGLGFEVAGVVATGEKAVDLALRDRPDLVLMDIQLAGDMDGAEAAARIREACDIPVVFLTAFTDEETLGRVKRTDPHGYLIKPFNSTELRITIEMALYKVDMERRLRVSERRLRLAQKMEAVGSLASGIAHDFNNILSAIIGYSEMALRKADPGEPLHKRLDRIHKAGMRGRNLVQLLLAFARPGGVERRCVLLGPLVEEALHMVAPTLPQGVRVRTDVAPEVPAVRGDPNQLHQVIMNLLTNAADAMAEQGGELVVSLDRGASAGEAGQESCVRLVVRDSGRGIDAEHVERIFDPFFTTKMFGRGTGMGLAVVHGIVDSYGGRVEVDSAPGRGAEFRVYMPEDTSGNGGALQRQALVRAAPGRGERIMVVDDEMFLMEMVRDLLEDMGYKATGLTEPEEALEMFRNDPRVFDLVITDQRMPHMSGEELAEAMRTARPDVPIILCTGFGGLVSAEQAGAMGFAEVVRKPLDNEAMLGAVRRVLDRTSAAT